jgi:hypothetical protein
MKIENIENFYHTLYLHEISHAIQKTAYKIMKIDDVIKEIEDDIERHEKQICKAQITLYWAKLSKFIDDKKIPRVYYEEMKKLANEFDDYNESCAYLTAIHHKIKRVYNINTDRC